MNLNSKNVRLIARLDIKGLNLVKTVQLEGLRVLGKPRDFALEYYEQGADEILFMDIVASLYGRSNLTEVIRGVTSDVFIPITVGGGIRNLDDITNVLSAGADKVAINTAAVRRPTLISEAAKRFGSQSIILSIEAKRKNEMNWEVYTDCGRESTGINVLEWSRKAVDLGAGEILITSIDQEGTRKGFDLELVNLVSDGVSVPVIASGGYGHPRHLIDVVEAGADAVAIASVLHSKSDSVESIKINVSS